ncbi:MAG TPA: nuclear transport factor 2 family protein [Polyangiaceae bacterium]|nr:nuclear transport factor 2 family protein [Polyangiaceae bacterium]
MADTGEIERAEDALLQAMLASDTDALGRLIADRLLFVAPNGAVATKAMDLENYRTRAQVVKRAERKALTIEMHGEDVAVTTALVELSLEIHGEPVEGAFRYIRTWKRASGSWSIIAGAVTPCR